MPCHVLTRAQFWQSGGARRRLSLPRQPNPSLATRHKSLYQGGSRGTSAACLRGIMWLGEGAFHGPSGGVHVARKWGLELLRRGPALRSRCHGAWRTTAPQNAHTKGARTQAQSTCHSQVTPGCPCKTIPEGELDDSHKYSGICKAMQMVCWWIKEEPGHPGGRRLFAEVNLRSSFQGKGQ